MTTLIWNPGQFGLGSSRPESAQPGQLGRVSETRSNGIPENSLLVRFFFFFLEVPSSPHGINRLSISA